MLRGRGFWSLCVMLAALPALMDCRTSAGLDGDRCPGAADTLVTLCVGQEVRAPDGVARIALLAVRNDSRCPVGAMCVWQGNAEVEIGVTFGMGPTVPYVLNTGVEPRAVALGTFRLALAELWPEPVSFRSIPQDRYVAVLRYERSWAPD